MNLSAVFYAEWWPSRVGCGGVAWHADPNQESIRSAMAIREKLGASSVARWFAVMCRWVSGFSALADVRRQLSCF